MTLTVLNFFAGPGAGKTTNALEVTAMLKRAGYEAEFVPEFARELAIEGRLVGYPQEVIFREQYRRIKRLEGHMQFAVCDSPILMQLAYTDDEALRKEIVDASRNWDRCNLFVYNPREKHSMVGRIHTREQAKDLDAKVLEIIHKHDTFEASTRDGASRKMFDMAMKGVQ